MSSEQKEPCHLDASAAGMFRFDQTVSFRLELVDLPLVCDQPIAFEFLNTNTDVCMMHLSEISIFL